MTAARKVLAHTLIVRHPDTDAPTGLLAGTRPPAWAKRLYKAADHVAEPADDNDGEGGEGATPKEPADN